MDNQTPPQPQETPAASLSRAPQPANPNSIQPANEPNKSNRTHTLIAVLLLLFVYPIGLIYMWFKTKWPKWLKIFLILLPIYLVLVGAVLTIFIAVKNPGIPKVSNSVPLITATPTPNLTANWKTLVANDCKISLQYPGDWEGNLTEGNGCLFEVKNPIAEKQLFTLNSLSGSSPSTIWSSILEKNPDVQVKIIGGIEGITTKPLEDETGSLHSAYFYWNNQVYNIIYFVPLDDKNTEEIYNKIISTIKFTQ